MNRFRVNLHPALFFEGLSETPREITFPEELKDLQDDMKGLVPLAGSKSCIDPVMKGEREFYSDVYLYEADKERFQLRCKQPKQTLSTKERRKKLKNKDKQALINNTEEKDNYEMLWNGESQKSFGVLVEIMTEKGLIRKKGEEIENDGKRKRTLDELILEYRNEITQQLRDKVRNTSDKKFDEIKNTLFTRESGVDYPANKVYCKLTGALSIFNTDNRVIRGRGTSTVEERSETTNNPGNEKASEMSERQQRKFLSKDLPNFLWNIRRTPGILKTLSRLPIFSLSEDRPSEVDRDAIDDFLKVASSIKINPNYKTNDKSKHDSAVALYDFISSHTVNMNDGPQEYKKKLEEKGMSIDNKYLDDLVSVGYFFKQTQNKDNAAKDQHAIYLSVLQVIKEKNGVKNAIAYLKPLVEKSKDNKSKEKELGYKSGQVLDRLVGDGSTNYKIGNGETQNYYGEYKNLAEKLGILDFTSVTRLAQLSMNGKDKFQTKDEVKILADLNNDGNINTADNVNGGTNTGQQFEEICDRIGKDTALNNLINRAKLENNILGLGLNEDDITIGAIKAGNIKVILLLQNIISKPGEDLYDLLSGKETKSVQAEAEETGQLGNEVNKVSKDLVVKRKELIDEIYGGLKEAKIDDEHTTNSADLQASLATCLYDNYRLGIGAGSTLSLDEWAKGLKIGAGLQVRDNKSAIIGLNVSYDKEINVGRGWTITPALNAGAFLPIASGSEKLLASLGLSVDVEKKTVNLEKHRTVRRGLEGGVSFVPTAGVVVYGGYHYDYDKAENAESYAKYESFKIEKLLNDAFYGRNDSNDKHTEGILEINKDKNFDLEKTKEIIKNSINRDNKIRDKEKEKVITDVLGMLSKYQGVKLTDNAVKGIILGIKKQYEKSRLESYKASLVDKTHISGGSIGGFVGEGGVGVYGTIDTKTYYSEGYGSGEGVEHEIENGGEEITKDVIKTLNTNLGLKKDKEMLKIKDYGIFIPTETTKIVKVSKDMKGRMKKVDGGVMMSKRTTMHDDVDINAPTTSAELHVGQGSDSVYLDAVAEDRFVNTDIGDIDSEILRQRNKELLSIDNLKVKLQEAKVPVDDCENVATKILKEIEGGTTDKKLKIKIKQKAEGEPEVTVTEERDKGSHVEISFMQEKELFNPDAKKIAKKVYDWAATLKDPKPLRSVKHPKEDAEKQENYKKFLGFLDEGKYDDAKNRIIETFKTLNRSYGNDGLQVTEEKIDGENWPENEDLGQLLMSMGNIFARASYIVGEGQGNDGLNKYKFEGRTIGDIIKNRASDRQIRGTIEKNETLEPDIKDAYLKLIDASERYRKEHTERYNKTSASAASLNNTVGFNLGDHINPENPLLNPEVYDKVINAKELESENDFTPEKRKKLHEHLMRKFVESPILSKSIKEIIGKNTDLKGAEFSLEENTGKLTITKSVDNKEEKYIISSDMKVGFFTQCANLIIILDNISINVNGQDVPFNSDAFKNGKLTITPTDQIIGKSVFGAGIAITASKGGKESESGEKSSSTPGETGKGEVPTTNPTGTTENLGNDIGGNGQGGGGTVEMFND